MKSSQLALLTLVFGLALGFAGGSLLGGSLFGQGDGARGAPGVVSAAEPGAPLSPDDRPGPGSDSSLAAVQPSAPGASEAGSTAPKSAAPGPNARAAARRALAASSSGPAQDRSTWNHSIRGSVVDPSGAPMAGVKVISTNRPPRYAQGLVLANRTDAVGRGWDYQPEPEEKLATTAQQLLEDKRNSVACTTDANGRFELTDLREGLHMIQAFAEGYDLKGEGVHTGQEAELVAVRVLEMELDVRLPDGTQPVEAVVSAGQGQFGKEFAWSPKEPRLRLKEGSFELTVRAGHVQRPDWRTMLSDFASEPRPINLETDGPGPYVVQLQENQILRVAVDDASELVPKLPLWVKAVPGTSAEDVDWSSDTVSSLVSSRYGFHEIMGLPPGPFVLAAGRGEGSDPETTAPLTIERGITKASMALGEVDLSQFLVVRCLRTNGDAVDPVDFQFERKGGEGSRPGRWRNGRVKGAKARPGRLLARLGRAAQAGAMGRWR